MRSVLGGGVALKHAVHRDDDKMAKILLAEKSMHVNEYFEIPSLVPKGCPIPLIHLAVELSSFKVLRLRELALLRPQESYHLLLSKYRRLFP